MMKFSYAVILSSFALSEAKTSSEDGSLRNLGTGREGNLFVPPAGGTQDGSSSSRLGMGGLTEGSVQGGGRPQGSRPGIGIGDGIPQEGTALGGRPGMGGSREGSSTGGRPFQGGTPSSRPRLGDQIDGINEESGRPQGGKPGMQGGSSHGGTSLSVMPGMGGSAQKGSSPGSKPNMGNHSQGVPGTSGGPGMGGGSQGDEQPGDDTYVTQVSGGGTIDCSGVKLVNAISSKSTTCARSEGVDALFHLFPIGVSADYCHGWSGIYGDGRMHYNSAKNIRCSADGTKLLYSQFPGSIDCKSPIRPNGVEKEFVLNECHQGFPPQLTDMGINLDCCLDPFGESCMDDFTGTPRTFLPGSKEVEGEDIWLNGEKCDLSGSQMDFGISSAVDEDVASTDNPASRLGYPTSSFALATGTIFIYTLV